MKIITNAEQMMCVAKNQGIEMSVDEAIVLLNCLEDCDQQLMEAGDGQTYRHDRAFPGEEDMIYSVADLIGHSEFLLGDAVRELYERVYTAE